MPVGVTDERIRWNRRVGVLGVFQGPLLQTPSHSFNGVSANRIRDRLQTKCIRVGAVGFGEGFDDTAEGAEAAEGFSAECAPCLLKSKAPKCVVS